MVNNWTVKEKRRLTLGQPYTLLWDKLIVRLGKHVTRFFIKSARLII